MKKSSLRSFYKQNERLINWCIILITFSIGFFVSEQFIFQIPSEEEYTYFEKIGYDIYNQSLEEPLLYEVPEGFNVSITNTSIEVGPDILKTGFVKGSLVNGEFTIKRVSYKPICIVMSILIGTVCSLIMCIVLMGKKNRLKL